MSPSCKAMLLLLFAGLSCAGQDFHKWTFEGGAVGQGRFEGKVFGSAKSGWGARLTQRKNDQASVGLMSHTCMKQLDLLANLCPG